MIFIFSFLNLFIAAYRLSRTFFVRLKFFYFMKNDNEKNSAHFKCRCQYYTVFVPKHRRQEIYGKIKKDIGEILRKLLKTQTFYQRYL